MHEATFLFTTQCCSPLGQDETMVAVALGFTVHLVQMINTFLDVPLRYPMEHRVSRSRVTDHIHDKLTEKDRE